MFCSLLMSVELAKHQLFTQYRKWLIKREWYIIKRESFLKHGLTFIVTTNSVRNFFLRDKMWSFQDKCSSKITPNNLKDDIFWIGVFLICNDKLEVCDFVLRVLNSMHFVLSIFRESLLASNQLSMLRSSSFALAYKVFGFFPEIRMLVSSAKAKQLLYFKHLGKSLTYIMKRRGPRIEPWGTEEVSLFIFVDYVPKISVCMVLSVK